MLNDFNDDNQSFRSGGNVSNKGMSLKERQRQLFGGG